MTPQFEAAIAAVQMLSSTERQQLLQLLTQIPRTTEPETTPQSFFEVAQAAIGAGEGPGDLSTNSDYMQSYGQ
ncbi:MAG: hypothetical protein KME15_16250 [Drouetiella hepatica Uher 2000/2452]|jgi:hypothetical protein|uniref:Uncharacterized protein n=1 Tax=Drouetiella hepatica Uher 2000/2452 TaxID=904376 RepID=A0A951QF44_9CYAN|nr:hypothetical protein [Drouetiella hepatica Uher 2000/2452]